jgi:hypothetical protein
MKPRIKVRRGRSTLPKNSFSPKPRAGSGERRSAKAAVGRKGRRLAIQLHFDKLPPSRWASNTEALEFLRSLATGPTAELVSCMTGRTYATIVFISTNLPAFWRSARGRMNRRGLRPATIVVCEGKHGWKDYLQLQHFDPGEALDHLSARRRTGERGGTRTRSSR